MNNLVYKKIPALVSGDTIGIFSSSAPLEESRFKKGVSTLESLGYKTKCPLDPSKYYGKYDYAFSSGSIEERANSINELFKNPDLKVLIAARGGDGALELLPHLDFKSLAKNPKLIVGFSDVTVLLLQAISQASLVAIHGTTIGSSFADYDSDPIAQQNVKNLLQICSDPQYRISENVKILRTGNAEGRIIAANLTMLLSVLGTPWDLDYKDKILVLEDTGEKPYRIYRNLLQLKLAGKFDGLAALVLGRFSKVENNVGPTFTETINYFIKTHLSKSSFPVIAGLEVGHQGKNLPLPLGCLAKIAGDNFSTIEGACF